MARQPRTSETTSTPTPSPAPAVKKGEEKIESISSAPIEDVPEGPGLTKAAAEAAKPTMVKESASKPEDNELPEGEVMPPPPKQYRVLADGLYNRKGQRAKMRAGKVISALQYNIRDLKGQGIRLEPLDD